MFSRGGILVTRNFRDDKVLVHGKVWNLEETRILNLLLGIERSHILEGLLPLVGVEILKIAYSSSEFFFLFLRNTFRSVIERLLFYFGVKRDSTIRKIPTFFSAFRSTLSPELDDYGLCSSSAQTDAAAKILWAPRG